MSVRLIYRLFAMLSVNPGRWVAARGSALDAWWRRDGETCYERRPQGVLDAPLRHCRAVVRRADCVGIETCRCRCCEADADARQGGTCAVQGQAARGREPRVGCGEPGAPQALRRLPR